MSDAGILDFSGLDSAVTDAPVVDTPAVETPAVETPAADSGTPAEPAAGKEKAQQYNSDGTPVEKAAPEEDDAKEFGEKTPQEVRKALKAFRDSNPANAAMVKQLHGAYERYEAAKAIFPGGVKEIQQAKEFLDLVGGHEGYEKLQGTVAAAEQSDGKLYDPDKNAELIADVVADLKDQGKLANLGTLNSALLDATKTNDEKGYYKAFAPHFAAGLEEVNMPGAINGLVAALTSPELADADPAKAASAAVSAVKAAKEIAGGLKKWYDNLAAANAKTKEAVVSPERKQLDADRAAFLKQQEEFKTNQSTEFKNSVASTLEKSNNQLLGAELKAFLQMPFFKGFGRENLIPLGTTIKNELYAALKADPAYTLQMKSMWGAKTPDRQKIEEYHKARVASVAGDLVRGVVQKMYPSYSRGGAAAGRVAAVAEKKAVQGKVEQQAVATGKPIYVAVKPKDLDRTRKDSTLLEITGKGYLPNGKFVTWRKG